MPIAFSFSISASRLMPHAALIDADDKQMPGVLVIPVGTLSGLNGVSASSRR